MGNAIIRDRKERGGPASSLQAAAGEHMKFLEKQTPSRIIALGFLLVILTGSLLLMLPICVRDGVTLHYIDALFTSTSAVCVTGLIAVDAADTFTPIGQAVVALLIQIGGLGVTSLGVGFMLAMRKRVNLKERLLVREALNADTGAGMVSLVKWVLIITLCFESAGALLSFLVFSRRYPPLHALGISVFHSIAAFNNSGFDILGGFRNLLDYENDILLNLTTAGLIIFGGLGFLVIADLMRARSFRKLSFHSQAVITTTLILLAAGTVLLKLTEHIGWLPAFFTSVSARTAGFSTVPLGSFSKVGLLITAALMFIGASPGSTGGGIKTTTLFTLFHGIRGAATNTEPHAFRYRFSDEAFRKAAIVTTLAGVIVCTGTIILCALEPAIPLEEVLFEITSAFGTVGLSTGITPGLSWAAKLLEILIMYIGRLGPFTVFSIWVFKADTAVSYVEGTISIG